MVREDKTDARHLRMLLAEGRLPECWIPPSHILECRALLETYHDLRAEHTARGSASARCCSTRAPRRWATARCAPTATAALRAAAAAHLSPAGQLQVATALEMLDGLEARLRVVRHQLLALPGT